MGLGYHLSVPPITQWNQAAYPVSCSDKSGLGRAVLQRYYMWHFSMQGLPVNNVAIKNCELLPHIFTLSSLSPPLHKLESGLGGEVIFCGTFCCIGFRQNTRLFTGALLCAVRTFLFSLN